MTSTDTKAAPSFNSSIPVFPVEDVAAALTYYEDVLGFQRDFLWPAESDSPTYAGVIRGKVQIHIAQHDVASDLLHPLFAAGELF